MCAPIAVTAGAVLTSGAPIVAYIVGYVVALVVLVGVFAANYRSSLKKLFSKG